MNHSVTANAVVITSTAEHEIERNLHLVIERLLLLGDNRELHANQERGAEGSGVCLLTVAIVCNLSSGHVKSPLRQIRGVYG